MTSMDKQCDICGFIKNPTSKTQILDTQHWRVVVGDNQAYLGRAYVTLKEHKGSLGSLSQEEWSDFIELVAKLETAYKDALGAEPLNWGCFMNHAFREEPFNPHVHWHIYPRYKKAPVINGVTYDDKLFGNFYDDKAERIVSADIVEQIATILKQHLKQS